MDCQKISLAEVAEDDALTFPIRLWTVRRGHRRIDGVREDRTAWERLNEPFCGIAVSDGPPVGQLRVPNLFVLRTAVDASAYGMKDERGVWSESREVFFRIGRRERVDDGICGANHLGAAGLIHIIGHCDRQLS